MSRPIKVKGILREEIDHELYAMVLYLAGKRAVEAKRRRAAIDRERRTQEGTAIED